MADKFSANNYLFHKLKFFAMMLNYKLINISSINKNNEKF